VDKDQAAEERKGYRANRAKRKAGQGRGTPGTCPEGEEESLASKKVIREEMGTKLPIVDCLVARRAKAYEVCLLPFCPFGPFARGGGSRGVSKNTREETSIFNGALQFPKLQSSGILLLTCPQLEY
jgi:hypothetical protein